MSHSHYIRTMLDFKDKSITFLQFFCKELKIKGTLSKVFYGTLTYTPYRCVNCGMKKEDASIIKYGFKTSRLTLNSTSHYPTYLLLKNNAFIVKNVRRLFVQKQGK